MNRRLDGPQSRLDVLEKRKIPLRLRWLGYLHNIGYKCYSLTTDCHPFPALRQNLGGHKFKDAHEVETFVTRWRITQDTDIDKQKISSQDMANASFLAGTMWKING
jgi:hypothetical protein